VTTSSTSDGSWPVAMETPAGHGMRDGVGAEQGAARRPVHKLLGWLDDAALLLLAAWLTPLAILLVGAPVVLLVRLLIEITKRM
jgi:hypothetical protein